MTNQNDTQDEAEMLAWKVECSKAWASKTPEEFHEYIFKQGYRAGVSSKEAEIASLKHDLATKSSTDLISEKYRLREQLAASRAEVERLVKAADKFRVATCKYADGKMRRVVFTMHLDQISEALANYNTDSGDGSGKMETNK